jgi:hypothetical protein
MPLLPGERMGSVRERNTDVIEAMIDSAQAANSGLLPPPLWGGWGGG